MEGIAFELSGCTAFFKKPDVNEYAYYTYSHIHKIALIGLLGSILGLGGYWQQFLSAENNADDEEQAFPEFYRRLHGLETAIVPHGDRGYFSKKIQAFNNSVGYASQEKGGNLIVREQWLEHPRWTIYLMPGGTTERIFDRLTDSLLAHRSVYIPYLGKNDHPAQIDRVRQVRLEQVSDIEGLDSLFPVDEVTFAPRGTADGSSAPYFFSEWMPVGLSKATNHYVMKELAYTNKKLKVSNEHLSVYSTEERNLCFI